METRQKSLFFPLRKPPKNLAKQLKNGSKNLEILKETVVRKRVSVLRSVTVHFWGLGLVVCLGATFASGPVVAAPANHARMSPCCLAAECVWWRVFCLSEQAMAQIHKRQSQGRRDCNLAHLWGEVYGQVDLPTRGLTDSSLL